MKIQIRKFLFFLSLLVLILLLMHFFPESLSQSIHNRFDLNAEANIPTWYTTVLLFLVSICSLVIYMLRRYITNSDYAWNSFWLLFACVYCFLSLDESSRLHELIDQHAPIKWVYVYAPFSAIFFFICLAYLFIVRRDSKSLLAWVIGGLLFYATGGLFSEFISYYFYPLPEGLQQVEFVIEEGLEMLGTIMVLMGCFQELNYLNEKHLHL